MIRLSLLLLCALLPLGATARSDTATLLTSSGAAAAGAVTPSARVQKTRIVPGQPLKQGEQLVSADGKFTLELSDSVGMIMRDSTGKALWVLNVQPALGVDRLDMQSDKNLVLYTKQGQPLWASNVSPAGVTGNERCVIDGSGELVASNWVGTLWSSSSATDLIRMPSDSYLKQQESLLPHDASGALYVPVSRPGDRTEIVPNQPLKKGERLMSISGKYWLELSDETGFVLRDVTGQALWNPGVQGTPVDHLSMQDDKNLVLYTAEGKPVWAAGISSSGVTGNEKCVLEADGELVASNWGGVLWTAGSAQGPGLLPSGGILKKGQSLHSSDNQYTLTLLRTGNVVLTDSKGNTVWMTGLVDPDIDHLVMQYDGNLVLVTNTNTPLWATNTVETALLGKSLRVNTDGTLSVAGRTGGRTWSSGQLTPGRLNPGQGLAPGGELRSARGRLRVQDDGNVVLYDSRDIARWSTGTMGKTLGGLSMRTDGKLVLYGQDGSELWSFEGSDSSKPFELRGMGLSVGGRSLLLDQLYDGDTLQQGAQLLSPNNQFQLTLERDGQLTLRRVSDQQPRWSNGVKTQDEVWLAIQNDQNLIEYTQAGPVWSTNTQGNGTSGMGLGLDDNGVLSLRRNVGLLVWQQGWPLQLLSGTSLKPGEAIGSKNGKYVLTFTQDGNLELTQFGAAQNPVWSSNSAGKGGNVFTFQPDGNLVISTTNITRNLAGRPNPSVIWAANKYQGRSRYALTLTDQGQIQVSEVGGKNTWFVP